jgi:hypothetical protein
MAALTPTRSENSDKERLALMQDRGCSSACSDEANGFCIEVGMFYEIYYRRVMYSYVCNSRLSDLLILSLLN